MFSRIGVTTKVYAMPLAAYLVKARNREFGAAMLGWGSLAADLALRSLAATPNAAKGWGAWNWARYSNPALDKLIDRSLTTVDEKKRELAAREASVYAAREVAFIPLHYQVVTWAMRRSLDYTPRTDEFTFAFDFRQVSERQEAQPVHEGAR
jgi:peptide/nickel transport system substrate-binding protein